MQKSESRPAFSVVWFSMSGAHGADQCTHQVEDKHTRILVTPRGIVFALVGIECVCWNVFKDERSHTHTHRLHTFLSHGQMTCLSHGPFLKAVCPDSEWKTCLNESCTSVTDAFSSRCLVLLLLGLHFPHLFVRHFFGCLGQKNVCAVPFPTPRQHGAGG